MAYLHIDHLPETVKVQSPLNIILPDPGTMSGVPVRERKVLYLLHGLSDDASAWQRYSAIETYAKTYGIVVVMPSVSRSFYLDQPNGQKYFTYVTEELPQYLQDVFGIVPDREKQWSRVYPWVDTAPSSAPCSTRSDISRQAAFRGCFPCMAGVPTPPTRALLNSHIFSETSPN